MPSVSLFPSDEPIVPARNRRSPALWIERLVVVPDLGSVKPIREVPFRRGLNIIQTKQRKANEAQTVGHSVGKTLLMRLIRYTLGETHYATEQVRPRIGANFPNAQVIAHWIVNDKDWIVVRPMVESRKSFVIESDDWHAAGQKDQKHLPFADFLSTVNNAVLTGLEEFSLPNTRRPPHWLDVLGWLARDYECGYRAPNEWRHPDADSSPKLDRDDNSLILQWMAGLMGKEEIDLKDKHQELLRQRQTAKSNLDTAKRTVEVTGPILKTKLELSDEEAQQTDTDSLFADKILEKAKTVIGQLGDLRKERIEQSKLTSLEATEKTELDNLVTARANVEAVEILIKFAEKKLEQHEKGDSPPPYSLHMRCPKEDCPLKPENNPKPKEDPAKKHFRTEIQNELTQLRKVLAEKTAVRDSQQKTYSNVKNTTVAARDQLSTTLSGIDQKIGQRAGEKDDAENFITANVAVVRITKAIDTITRRIDTSNELQETVRRNIQNKLRRLSNSYARTLKAIFGPDAEGKIRLDGHGLHPEPDDILAPSGAALSIMTTVLAFDLSMLAASIEGNGAHPRLLIHDSPREGDMEPQMFHRLFQIGQQLEQVFGSEEPSFQYIVTTTTPPPPELANEKGPFVRLTLDARNLGDLLLKTRF